MAAVRHAIPTDAAGITDAVEHVFVAEEEDVIVGFATYFVHDDEATAEFNTIYLHPDHWRHGVGRQLHDALVEDMRKQHCNSSVLWVHPDNTRARAFYERCGWSETGETKVEPSWGEQMPAIQYGKTL